MWSCLLLADAGSESITFSGVSVVAADGPMALSDGLDRLGPGPVLVVAPRSLAEPLRLGLTVAAGRRPDLALTGTVSDHAPLAILSALALALTTTDEPAVGVELAHRLLAQAWSGAWSGSVAKLENPSPRLAQHLRSMLPGAGFLIRQAPLPQVLGPPRPDDVPSVGRDRVLLVEDGAVPPEFVRRLSETESVSAVRPVALPGRWTSVYGSDRTGQLALMPAAPQTLIGSITQHCPTCGLNQVAAVCPFCRNVNVNRPTVGVARRSVRGPVFPPLAGGIA